MIKKPNGSWIDQSLEWIVHNDQHIVTIQDARYPRLLKEIHCPPILLFVKGDVDLLATPQIAMVGSRNPSPIGLELAREFAFDFATVGLCVTSGLALGIDGASHEGALKANGKTIAVLGAGLHHIYPQRHVKLSEKIATHGALVSEFPLQIAPMSKNFPRRNRIVSGLSLGTLAIGTNVPFGIFKKPLRTAISMVLIMLRPSKAILRPWWTAALTIIWTRLTLVEKMDTKMRPGALSNKST